MQNAITCNAKALFKMESHDYEGAFNLLRTSMLSLTGTLQSAMKTSPPMDPPYDGGIVLVSTGYDRNFDRFYSGSFLFSLPLTENIETLSYRQIDYCSATCLYNMALACHLEHESATCCSKKNKLLCQSRILYLTAYQILQKYPIDPTDSVVLLLMALCSNLIDIEMEYGSVDEVKFWRRILEDASFAADPYYFTGSSVYVFFDSIYIAPGELRVAKAA
jgi:hypothetical protein